MIPHIMQQFVGNIILYHLRLFGRSPKIIFVKDFNIPYTEQLTNNKLRPEIYFVDGGILLYNRGTVLKLQFGLGEVLCHTHNFVICIFVIYMDSTVLSFL